MTHRFRWEGTALWALIQQQLFPCSKALRVQHDRPQTIQGQPFEQGHLKPCWVGRLAFHCGSWQWSPQRTNCLQPWQIGTNVAVSVACEASSIRTLWCKITRKESTSSQCSPKLQTNHLPHCHILRNYPQILFGFLMFFVEIWSGDQGKRGLFQNAASSADGCATNHLSLLDSTMQSFAPFMIASSSTLMGGACHRGCIWNFTGTRNSKENWAAGLSQTKNTLKNRLK